MKLLDYSIEAFSRNTNLILLFSLPFLAAFVIPIFVAMPTFPAVGGIYLRTGSIPTMTMFESGVMVAAFLLSLYLVSLTIVNINIVIKAQRSSVNIKQEVIKGISTTTFAVFLLYIFYTMALLVVQLIAYQLPISVHDIFVSLVGLLISIPFFFAPAAMVIDEVAIDRSLKVSMAHVLKKPVFFMFWLVVGLVLVSAITWLSYTALSAPYGSFLSIFLNSLIALPFLIVMQTQMYLAKYTILT